MQVAGPGAERGKAFRTMISSDVPTAVRIGMRSATTRTETTRNPTAAPLPTIFITSAGTVSAPRPPPRPPTTGPHHEAEGDRRDLVHDGAVAAVIDPRRDLDRVERAVCTTTT